ATAVSTTQINLTWVDASNNETGFQIERSLTSGTGFTLLKNTSANTTSFSDTGLAADTRYFYRVRAFNAVGNSAYTAQASSTTAIPAAPTTPTATAASSTRINLTWADNSNNETGFQIERSLTAGSGFTLIATTGANATSFGNTGLTVNTTYFYRIRAINAVGNSIYTSEVSARTSAPTAPTTLVATATSTTQINLTWVDASNNETGFQIERSLTTGTGFTLVTTTTANVTSFSNTGLTANTQYFYRVRSTNAVGSSVFTPQASARTSVPAAPTTLVATATSSSQINVCIREKIPRL
ncbi:MAG: fibronectin type III domain-containing protein, partial [Flammeovirgaceae bacterium]